MSSLRFFICYRRNDSRFLAYLLGDFLRKRVGFNNVFIDVDTVVPGDSIWSLIKENLTSSNLVLALMGPNWNAERLTCSKDWVRRELELAYEYNIPIIPVTHSGASKKELLSTKLPDRLMKLKEMHPLEILDPPDHLSYFEAQLQKVLQYRNIGDLPPLRSPLSGVNIGLSTSESEKGAYDIDPHLVRYTIVAIPEFLLSKGSSITYGGLPNFSTEQGVWNVTQRLVDLAQDFPRKIINKSLSNKTEKFEKGIHFLQHISDEQESNELSQDGQLASKLLNLRKTLVSETQVRICIGGKSTGYVGAMPGVVEEVMLAISANQPVFLLGGFGGATMEMCNILRGKDSKFLTLKHQKDKNTKYESLIEELSKVGQEPCYKVLKSELSKGASILNNGLSSDENEMLMKTERWRQASRLILKGLDSLISDKKLKPT